MPGSETLTWNIFVNDRASEAFRNLARQAENASGDVRDLGVRLTEVGKQVATARVKLEGDKEAQHQLDTLGVKLLALGRKAANPDINVEGIAKATAQLSGLELALDKLDGRTVNVTVDVDRSLLSRLGGGIGGLFGGIGGGIGAIGSAAGALGQAAPSLQAAAITSAITAALATAPALLPLGLGALAGGGAVTGAVILGAKANKQLVALQKSLASAKGPQKAVIQSQIAALRKSSAGELGVFGGVQDLGMTARDVFSQALEARGPGIGAGPHYVPGAPSFLTSLTGIFQQIGRWLKTLGPLLGNLFRASVPYLQLFVKFLERAAILLLPAFTKMLQEMTPFLPVILKGLLDIVKGFVGFLNAIGPSGMKAAARIFVVAAEGMAAVMVALGHTINWLTEHIPTWVHNIAAWWDRLFRSTAFFFDLARHVIAAFFDRVLSLADTWRHGWAHIWDTIYSDTIGAVIRIWKAVIGWFQRLPGQVTRALSGLGSSLWHLGAGWVTELWNGIKHVWGSVIGWFKNLPQAILHAIGIGSPPGWAISAGEWIMKGLHIGLDKASGLPLRLAAGVAGKIGGLFGAGSFSANQAIAVRMLPLFGFAGNQMPALIALWNRESGWNQFARNPASGAYGIPQALPPTKLPFAGQAAGGSNPAAQIMWGLSYIKSRYGTPANAWAHELAFGWYDRGGFLPPGLTLAYNATGRPEMVTPARGAAGNTYQITVHTGPATPSREVGRVLVEHIRAFEHGSGKGWRS